MSRIKNWLMEMQEYSYHLLDEMEDDIITIDEARQQFVDKYGETQVTVLNDMIAEWEDSDYHEHNHG